MYHIVHIDLSITHISFYLSAIWAAPHNYSFSPCNISPASKLYTTKINFSLNTEPYQNKKLKASPKTSSFLISQPEWTITPWYWCNLIHTSTQQIFNKFPFKKESLAYLHFHPCGNACQATTSKSVGVERTCRVGVILQRLYFPLVLKNQYKLRGARKEGPGQSLCSKVVLSFPDDNTGRKLSTFP